MGHQSLLSIINDANYTFSTMKPEVNTLTPPAPSTNATQPKGSSSLAAVVSAFVPTWITGLIFVLIFVLIRRHYPSIYAPRTYMGIIPEKHRTPTQRPAYFDWVRTLYRVPDKFLLYHESLDAYLYLRFLRTIIFICVVGSCLTWPILMPINAAGGTSTGLDKIGIGNVTKKNYLYAHAIIAWVFLVFIMFTIARERLWLIGLRQAWATSKRNGSRLSSRTVLFLSCPRDALQESNMHHFFGENAIHIWPVTQVASLEALVSDRDAKISQLEEAEVSLIQSAHKKTMKERKNNQSQNADEPSYDSLSSSVKKAIRPKQHSTYNPASEKVDTIRSLREVIKEKESSIEEGRKRHEQEERQEPAAVLVEFKTLSDAQQAFLQVPSTEILALSPRYLGVLPKDIIWQNLSKPPAQRISQEGLAATMVILLIVFWSIPSGFIGLVSNISYLAENIEWLAWLENLPDPVIELLSGLVPPILTSLLSKYVANIFRFIFKSIGSSPTNTSNELKVQKWFYIYQVTQVFLVTAVFSSGATVFSQLIDKAKNPVSIPELLAKQLPTSSNYYLSYFIIQGITSSADNLLNWSTLLQYIVFGWFFDKTPRQKFNRYTSMKGIAWGKVFPKFANFAIIAIAYSCIAPLVLGFAAVGLGLYYFSYRYNLLFVIQPKIDTRGVAYTLALQHLLTGVYIAELALIGLCGLKSATGPGIMIGVLILITILYHHLTNLYLAPLEKDLLPVELTHEYEGTTGDETTALLSSAEEGRADDGDGSPSYIQRLGRQARVPQRISGPLSRFFEPHVFATHRAIQSWLREDEQAFHDLDDDGGPEYDGEEELRKAYLNPALTSSTPVIWLPRDRIGASGNEVRENEEAGLKASDKAAWIDEGNGRVYWDEQNFDEVPL